MKNKKFKKIQFAFNLVFISLLIFSQAGLAQAISVSSVMGVKTPPSFMDSIFEDLDLDKNKLKANIQTFNFSDLKKTPPLVSLFFSPANPSEGEKVTVTASPTYFLNDPKDLYFTWFLKSKDCTDSKDKKYEYNKDCDLDNNGEVDIKDYKIKATRIIVNGGFIISSDDIYKSSIDGNNDGYEAYSGGDDQKGKTPHCYVHNTKSGKEYEIDCGSGKNSHLFPHAENKETGDGEFGRDEEKFWHTDPNSNDTANRGNSDEANVAGLGINSFTWNYQKGDKVGVVAEGISTEPSPTNDSSYKTMWAMNEGMDEFDTEFDNNNGYPKTNDVIISTTVDSPIAGQTTYLTQTTLQEIEGEVVNGVGNIKTTVTMHNVVRDTTTQVLVSDTDVAETETVLNPTITYSTELFSADDFEVDIDDSIIENPSDLNDFLYDSLVSPQENTPGSNKLEINLSYSPLNPINNPVDIIEDPTGAKGDGDLLIIHSSIPNAKDTNYLQYDWDVYAAKDISSDIWGDPLLKSVLFESTQSVGLGIDTFKFKLGLPAENKYLKIVLTVTENVGDEDHPRKSTQDIIIPINSTEAKISAHTVTATTPSAINSNESDVDLHLGNEICKDNDLEKALCPVTKNQIVAISVPEENFLTENPDFLWTIDGKPFTYQYCFFDNCNLEKQTNTAYFPILKEVGEQYTVNLTATDEKGKKINISRNFQVVDPEITILSDNEETCQQTVIGTYFDVDGKSFLDYSRLNFWAYNNSDIKLKTETTGFVVSPENLSWEIDGDSITSANATLYDFQIDSSGVLTLPPKEKQGEKYNISVGTLYTQNNLVKKALNAIWGVTYNQFYEKSVSDDAIITMQDPPETKEGSIKPKKIFATIYSSTPTYLAFLLRIALTISLILFVTKMIFSLVPENNYREKD